MLEDGDKGEGDKGFEILGRKCAENYYSGKPRNKKGRKYIR